MVTGRALRATDRRRRRCEHDVVVSAVAGIRRAVCLRCGDISLSTTGWAATGVSKMAQATPKEQERRPG